jgi:PAS domain S-box-containing protein
LAVGAVALATLVRWPLDPSLGDHAPFATYYVAIFVVTWFSGVGPAVLALVLGAWAAHFFFLEPRFTWLIHLNGAADWIAFGLYIFVGVTGILVCEALHKARHQAAEQSERLSTTVSSIGDAVIATDLEGRITDMNPVSESLTGWQKADACGSPLDVVFRILDEETRLPAPSPARRALLEGAIARTTNRIVLIARDGTQRPIDDSAAPIRSASGEVSGCVLVFRDTSERRLAQTQQRSSQEQMTLMLESVTDGFMRYDRDWRVVYVNLEAERINHLSRSEMLGRILWELFPALVGTNFETQFRRAVTEQVTVEFENYYEPFGRWYSLKGYPSPGGGLTTFIRDITDQKQAQNALRASEERLAFVRRSSGVGFWYCDLPFNELEWDELVKAHFHLPSNARVTIDTFYERIHPDDRERTRRAMEQSIAERTPYEVDYRTVDPASGEQKWIRAIGRTFYAADGTPTRFDGVTLDVSAHKFAEQKLVESEARYRAIGESIDFGVWMCDAEGRNTYASDSFLRMVGISQKQYSEFGWGEVLHPEDVEATIEAWKACVQTRGTWDRVHRFRGADGNWHHVLARGVPLRDPRGKNLGWAGINLDISRLMEAEQEVVRIGAESERQRRLYETVLTNTPDFVYVFSLDHKVLYANESLIKMWGRGYDGAIGKTFLEIGYEPWHAEMHEREIDLVRSTKQPIRGVVPFDGTLGRRQYDYIFVPVFGADGEVEAVAGTTRDITDRLETEERQAFLVRLSDALRPLSDPVEVQAEASRLLGEHLGASRVVYFEIRSDDYVIERDHVVGVRSLVGRYPITSFGQAELDALVSGRTVIEADATAEPNRAPAQRAAFADIQVRGHVDVPLVKDGRFVAGMTVQISEPRNWTTHEVALIEETAERTWAAVERARFEAALRASEESRSLALDAAELGTFNIDLSTNILTSDERFRTIFAGANVPMSYEEAFAAIHPDDQSRIRDAVAAATRVDDPAPYAEEYRVIHPSGSVRWVFAKGRANFAGDGPLRRLVSFDGTIADITARKEAEADRERLLKRLRDQDLRKDEFLATLAHELRNPLAAARAAVQMMYMSDPPNADVQWARDVIDRQTVALTRLIDDLMDVSRINQGKIELKWEHVDLAKIVQDAIETSRPLIEEMGHKLTVTLPPIPVILNADLTRLTQVFQNLLNNAAKYTERAGRIDLRAELQGSDVVVSVKDTGIGIPADKLPTIFEMFSQVESALSRSQGGLGIGLNLVKRLIEMHGGSIEARSEGQSKGSEFLVRLPIVVTKTHAHTTSDDHHKAVPTSDLRILVVEDDRDVADGLAMLLKAMGNSVHTAHDGEEAVAAAKKLRPHVVLCDIGLPKLNGYEACRRMKKDAWDKKMILIALTGWGQEEDRRQSEEAGFDHHIVKPVDPQALMVLLAGLTAVKA